MKSVFKQLPPGVKPHARRAYGYADLRKRSIVERRKVYQGNRVEFIDFEIAFLEPFEFLGPAAGEVLVETRCTLVSPGTETAVLCGLPGIPRGIYPFPPGYSAVGTVMQVGKGLPGIAVGQRVAGRLSHASRGIMSQVSLFPVPDGVTDEQAAFIELGIITLQGVRRAQIAPGDRVAVVGQGLIGQMANRVARACGAVWIDGIASSRNRSASAVQSGAVDRFIALADKPVLSEVNADIVIEAVGTPGAVITAIECARPGGKVILQGSARGLTRNIDIFRIAQQRRINLIGAHISALPDVDVSPTRYTYREEGRLFIELLRTKRLEVQDLITWRAKPSECNAVYEVFARGGQGQVGVLFDWRNGL